MNEGKKVGKRKTKIHHLITSSWIMMNSFLSALCAYTLRAFVVALYFFFLGALLPRFFWLLFLLFLISRCVIFVCVDLIYLFDFVQYLVNCGGCTRNSCVYCVCTLSVCCVWVRMRFQNETLAGTFRLLFRSPYPRLTLSKIVKLN